MGAWDKIDTPEAQAAIARLAVDNDGNRLTAEMYLREMLLVDKAKLQRMIDRKAWANPRKYDAAVEAVRLK
jgi:hypothetical protein